MWSVVEKTALAEAEVEYHDHTIDHDLGALPGGRGSSARSWRAPSVVIWTTTPWTIPGNRAVAYGADIDYRLIEVDRGRATARSRGSASGWWSPRALVEASPSTAGIVELPDAGRVRRARRSPARIAAPSAARPCGYDFAVPLLAGRFRHHRAGHRPRPHRARHGADDFELGAQARPRGAGHGRRGRHLHRRRCRASPGLHVFKAAEPVIAALREQRRPARARHAGPQLPAFLALQGAADLPRHPAVVHPDGRAPTTCARRRWPRSTRPAGCRPAGRTGSRSMVESRPDWCVSRQRAWGVPIAVFVAQGHAARCCATPRWSSGSPRPSRQEGADAWFTADPAASSSATRCATRTTTRRSTDILDVWFDRGSTHAIVLEQRPELHWPAALYLEGSDQHRGWFQSSLLESCGTRGRAPYDAVLTHGFAVDAEGRKMSKSLGNMISPLDLMKTHGADILRLWAVSGRLHRGHAHRQGDPGRASPTPIAGCATPSAICSAPSPASARPSGCRTRRCRSWSAGCCTAWPSSTRWCASATASFDFRGSYGALHNFCADDLSAFYFDVRKDALYCDRRRQHRAGAPRAPCSTSCSRCLTAWLAPVLVFTDRGSLAHPLSRDDGSVHLRAVPELPAGWRDPALGARWERIRQVRRVVTGALEVERREKRIGASLRGGAHGVRGRGRRASCWHGLDLAELAITSGIEAASTAHAARGRLHAGRCAGRRRSCRAGRRREVRALLAGPAGGRRRRRGAISCRRCTLPSATARGAA